MLYTAMSLLCLCLVGCASSELIYSTPAKDGGQLYFLRPVSWKTSNSVVQELSLDVTAIMKGEEFIQPPVMNYTLRMPLEQADLGGSVLVRISMGQLVVDVGEPQRLFKSLDGDSHIIARYSVNLDEESFLAVLKSELPCTVQMEFPGGVTEILESKVFSESIQNLRLLVL